MKYNNRYGLVLLKDGTILYGKGFGSCTIKTGEVVFNTAMQGYQESLTDPSYAGQILISTYPLIGNYGISKTAFESKKIHVQGSVIRELCTEPEHRDSIKTLDEFLEEHDKPGLCEVDTRFLVRKIRTYGVMPGLIAVSKNKLNVKELIENIKFNYEKTDFIKDITIKKSEKYGAGEKKVVLIDYGVKNSIIAELVKRKIEVIAVPAYEDKKTILSYEPNGILVSNGPGNPAVIEYAHKTIRALKDYPMFGICLGHQLIAHAFGGDSYKLKFGHRGVNHPVINLKQKKVRITTQNHGFAVGRVPKDFEITEKSANDGSIEGIEHKDGTIFSVQYHPEATPGPHDSKYLFDRFVKML